MPCFQPIYCPSLRLNLERSVISSAMDAMHESQKWEMHLFRNPIKFRHSLWCLYVAHASKQVYVSIDGEHIHHLLLNIGNSLAIFESHAVSHNDTEMNVQTIPPVRQTLGCGFLIVFDFTVPANAKWIQTWHFVNQIFFCKSLAVRAVCCVRSVHFKMQHRHLFSWWQVSVAGHSEHFTFSCENIEIILYFVRTLHAVRFGTIADVEILGNNSLHCDFASYVLRSLYTTLTIKCERNQIQRAENCLHRRVWLLQTVNGVFSYFCFVWTPPSEKYASNVRISVLM